MERLEKTQCFVLSQFLSGYALDKIEKFDEHGFDNNYKVLFQLIKKQYLEFGEVDLLSLDFPLEKSNKMIDEYSYLSINFDKCIAQLNEHATNKVIDDITGMLKAKLISPIDAANKLLELNKIDSSDVFDVAKLGYESLLNTQHTIETGIYLYDSHVEDWKLGELTTIYGRNGEGKTTLISQIIAHNLNRKVKTFLYSGEMSENKLQSWLYHQVVGQDKDAYTTIQTKYGSKRELKPNVINAIKEWHKDTFYLYNRNTKRTIREMDRLFTTMESCAKTGVLLFIIDNIMTALEENADSLYSDQANFVQRCKDFVIKNKVHIVLLAHPNKEKKEITGEKGNLDKTDISGSYNISNKSDNIVSVERVWNEEIDIDLILTSQKDRESGQRKIIPMMFSKETLRFYDSTTHQNVRYDWKQYLKPEPKTATFYNGESQTFNDGEFDEMYFQK
ncbi:MAG TPA: DnaB-like helicase C-terminal domain-containing protein [Fusibacter sp.]|nr:DnaB-like helicase C-terminal domain-containing protein [Fusibacter sp.]